MWWGLGVRRLRSTNSTEATCLALSIGVGHTLICISFTCIIYTRQQTTLKLATSSIIEKTKNPIGVADISSIFQALSARNNFILPKSWNILLPGLQGATALKIPSFYWDSRDVLNEEHFKFPVSLCHERAGHVSCVTLHVTRDKGYMAAIEVGSSLSIISDGWKLELCRYFSFFFSLCHKSFDLSVWS